MDLKRIGVVLIVLFAGLFGAVGTVEVLDHTLSVQEYEPTETTIEALDIAVERNDEADDEDDTSTWQTIESGLLHHHFIPTTGPSRFSSGPTTTPLSSYAAGCNIVKEFATPGWRLSVRTYSWQY